MPVSCMYVCVAFIALYCIQVFIWRSSTAKGKQRRFWFDYMQLQEKRHVLRSDKDVERLDDRREVRAEGGRRFQREGAITAKDLGMAMIVLAEGQKAPACPYTYECIYVCMYVCMGGWVEREPKRGIEIGSGSIRVGCFMYLLP